MDVDRFRFGHRLERVVRPDPAIGYAERLQRTDDANDRRALVDAELDEIARYVSFNDIAHRARKLRDRFAGLRQQVANFDQDAPFQPIEVVKVDRSQALEEVRIDVVHQPLQLVPVLGLDQRAHVRRQLSRIAAAFV